VVVGLEYDDLPRDGRQAVALMTQEEAGVTAGATILVDGTRATKGGKHGVSADGRCLDR
jgi:hypothetical protein